MRGFNLEKYLSDYEQPGSVHPWGTGKDNYIPEETQRAREVDRIQKGKALGGAAIDLMASVSDHSARISRLCEIKMCTRTRIQRGTCKSLGTIRSGGTTWPTATRSLVTAEDERAQFDRESVQGLVAGSANEIIPHLMASAGVPLKVKALS